MITLRQEMIGDFEDGGVLFTLLHVNGFVAPGEEMNLNDFVLTYIDSDDDVVGVVANAAYGELLAA